MMKAKSNLPLQLINRKKEFVDNIILHKKNCVKVELMSNNKTIQNYSLVSTKYFYLLNEKLRRSEIVSVNIEIIHQAESF